MGLFLRQNNVIENPEAQILHDRADAEYVVIGADDKNCRLRLHDAPRRREPATGKGIVSVEAVELVPGVIYCVDHALVRPRQLVRQLKIVGRISETRSTLSGAMSPRIAALSPSKTLLRSDAARVSPVTDNPERVTFCWVWRRAAPTRALLMDSIPVTLTNKRDYAGSG